MAMIVATGASSVEASSAAERTWRESLKLAVRSGQELCRQLDLDQSHCSLAAEQDFPVFVPLEFLQKMEVGNPRDPLLLQVMARPVEMDSTGGGQFDPVGDAASRQQSSLLQKYDGRVLLLTSGACAVHCRYCFRRHFPYESVGYQRQQWEAALAHIASDKSLDEVILSGGDPLTVTDERLAWLIDELNRIEHISRIRIHTRTPVVIPQRIDQAMLDWIRHSRAAIYLVLHFNHAREVDRTIADRLAEAQAAGAVLLNQAVLLRGVNDSYEALSELCLRLVDARVMPYYLHQLDPVQGGMHFEVGDEVAKSLVRRLQESLPGYAVPKLVREIAGQPSKTPL